MTLSLEQLLSADTESIDRLLDVHFAQGQLLSNAHNSKLNTDAQISHQRELASQWLFQQKFQLASWGKPEFQKLLNGLNQYLSKQGSALSERLLAELKLTFLLLDALDKFHQLSPPIATRLLTLRPILLAYSLQTPDFWFSSHSMKKLFDQLYRSGLGLQEDLGRQADASISLMQQFIDKTMVHTLSSTEALFDLMKSYKEGVATANTRLSRLLKRLVESELGLMKTSFANKHSALILLNMADGLNLPEHWNTFLLKQLRPELNVLVVAEGAKSKTLSQLELAVSQFVSIYQTSLSDFDMTKAMSDSVILEAVLLKQFSNLKIQIESLFAATAADLLSLDSGMALPNTSDLYTSGLEPLAPVHEVSKALLEKVDHTRTGQWFAFHANAGDEEAQRIQLLLKLNDIQQYLFVNANGQKVLSCDFEQFAALLASQQLKVIDGESFLNQATQRLLTKLVNNFDAAEQAIIGKQQASQQAVAEQEQKKARGVAAEKARKEAEVLELEMQLGAKKIAVEQQEEASASDSGIPHDILRKLRIAIDGLLIGSWIELYNENGEKKQLKLAVKFAATHRFVFVTPEGITDCEIQRDDLIDAVVNKRIVIMETDQFFADRLNALLVQVEMQ